MALRFDGQRGTAAVAAASIRPVASVPPPQRGTAVLCVCGQTAAHSGANPIATYLPTSRDDLKRDRVNGPAHFGCGTKDVPAMFTQAGKTFSGGYVHFVSDFETFIGLDMDGGNAIGPNGRRLTRLVTVPVATWDQPTLTMAYAVLAAQVVRLNVHTPKHSSRTWQTAAGFASNIVPAAYRAAVNAILAERGAAFTLAAGTVTNSRVYGGGTGGGSLSVAITPATGDDLAALLAPPPAADGKSGGKSAPKS